MAKQFETLDVYQKNMQLYILIEEINQYCAWFSKTNSPGIIKMYYNDFNYYNKTKYKQLGQVVSLVTTSSIDYLGEYSYYFEDENKYVVLAENNTLFNLDKNLAIRKSSWDKMTIKKKQDAIKKVTDNLEKIKEKMKLEKEAQKKHAELQDIISTIIKNAYYYKHSFYHLEEVQGKVATGFFDAISAPVEKLYRVKKLDTTMEEKALKKLNQCSLEMLGQVKFIENQIAIMEYEGKSMELITLARESLAIVISLLQYETNDETIQKVDQLMQQIKDYINEIQKSNNIDVNYINEKLAENINSTIDEKIELFKSMTKDYHHMYDYALDKQ